MEECELADRPIAMLPLDRPTGIGRSGRECGKCEKLEAGMLRVEEVP